MRIFQLGPRHNINLLTYINGFKNIGVFKINALIVKIRKTRKKNNRNFIHCSEILRLIRTFKPVRSADTG